MLVFALVDRSALAQADAEKLLQPTVAKAITYLETKGQAADGSYSGYAGIGPTALITTALIQHGVATDSPQVAKSLKFIEQHVQPDGGIYQEGSRYRNYETCLGVMCFSAANADGKYKSILAKADAYLKGTQWDEGEQTEPSDASYGGGGYGADSRPDLSNTAFLIEALQATGNGADSEAMKRALIFVSRCQNLETEYNTTRFAAKNPDGGFYYTPVGDGSSQAGETANGGLRSYGAMTYAGLKSMLYAGVGPDDPRVKAATQWVTKHYAVDQNPGLGDAGLYYYYQLFAKALDATGEDTITDADGQTHQWKHELIAELAKRQKDDGSWSNSNDKWLEGDSNLATGFALMALSHCKPSEK